MRDRDDDVQVDEAVDTAPRERLARVLTEEARMHGVGGGTSFGNFVHETLEKAPFQAAARDELRSEVERSAERFSVAGRHLDGVTAWLARTLDTPLDAAGFCLAQLDRGARIDEMEFWLPVGHHAGDARLVSRIAAAIEAHSQHPNAGAIAARIGALDAREIRGYLRGFIDLVYVHEGRWWLVDYKTNRLSSAAAYASDALGGTMAETLYGLQYHSTPWRCTATSSARSRATTRPRTSAERATSSCGACTPTSAPTPGCSTTRCRRPARRARRRDRWR